MSKVIALPFAIVNGRVNYTENTDDQLTNHVFSVLTTQPGERVMRPTYGADLMQFDFGLGDAMDQSVMQEVASRALQRWEPNATLLSVVFADRPDDYGILSVTITYAPTAGGAAVTTKRLVGVLGNGTVTETSAPDNAINLLGASTSPPTVVSSSPRYLGTQE